MKLEKFSTMFTDFRFWLTNTIYDALRVDKRNIIKEYNLSFAATTADFEVLAEGNVLQIDGISGNNEMFIRFNELNSPQYRILGNTTFRIPFYRFFVSCNHLGGALASQIRFKVNANCKYDSLMTVDLAGKNVNVLSKFRTMRTMDLVVPAGGTADLDFSTFTTSNMYVRFMKLYNPDLAITLGLRFSVGSPNVFPLFATQLLNLDFSAPLWVNPPTGGSSIFRFENPGANPVTVNIMFGMEIDNYFV